MPVPDRRRLVSAPSDSATIYTLAKALARPVARGLLPLAVADACVLATALQTNTKPYDPVEIARHGAWIIRRDGLRQRDHRDRTAYWIERTAWRMADRKALGTDIIGAAHTVNRDAGAPLDEAEVHALVVEVLRSAARQARQARRQ